MHSVASIWDFYLKNTDTQSLTKKKKKFQILETIVFETIMINTKKKKKQSVHD